MRYLMVLAITALIIPVHGANAQAPDKHCSVSRLNSSPGRCANDGNWEHQTGTYHTDGKNVTFSCDGVWVCGHGQNECPRACP